VYIYIVYSLTFC